MQQYFVKQTLHIHELFSFTDEQAHHIVKVMRMKEGETVKIVDGKGQPFLARIKYDSKDVIAEIVKGMTKKKENLKITLIQGMIKKDKWDFLIQKCVELGVDTIIPMVSSRTIVKIDKQDDKKIVRYNKIALEACEQCKRDTLVQVQAPILFKDITKYKKELSLLAYEDATHSCSLKGILNQHPHPKEIVYVVGSEGGFSFEEVCFLEENGFQTVSLGSRILRAETAAMAIINQTHYHYD